MFVVFIRRDSALLGGENKKQHLWFLLIYLHGTYFGNGHKTTDEVYTKYGPFIPKKGAELPVLTMDLTVHFS